MQLYVLFTLGFPAAPQLNCLTSLHTITRRTVLQKVPHRTNIVLCVLVNIRFQVLFHSPPGVLFTFPSQYCSTIGHQVVFRLGGWSPRLLTGFLVSADTMDTASRSSPFVYGTLTPCGWLFHTIRLGSVKHGAVQTPRVLLLSVSPLPLSLATTRRISFDFSSSGYLDVSVPRVPRINLWIQLTLHGSSP